jgi:LPXTG-motif cell wall-anchored protein
LDRAGDIFVADNHKCVIRRVDHSTHVITTIAGNGGCSFGGDGADATSASLNGPQEMSFDAAGNLFVADTTNNRIREIASASPSVGGIAEAPDVAALPTPTTGSHSHTEWYALAGATLAALFAVGASALYVRKRRAA